MCDNNADFEMIEFWAPTRKIENIEFICLGIEDAEDPLPAPVLLTIYIYQLMLNGQS